MTLILENSRKYETFAIGWNSIFACFDASISEVTDSGNITVFHGDSSATLKYVRLGAQPDGFQVHSRVPHIDSVIVALPWTFLLVFFYQEKEVISGFQSSAFCFRGLRESSFLLPFSKTRRALLKRGELSEVWREMGSGLSFWVSSPSRPLF